VFGAYFKAYGIKLSCSHIVGQVQNLKYISTIVSSQAKGENLGITVLYAWLLLLQDRMLISMVKGGVKLALRFAILSGIFTVVGTSLMVIRNDINPLDQVSNL
jgi:hypothetical protein